MHLLRGAYYLPLYLKVLDSSAMDADGMDAPRHPKPTDMIYPISRFHAQPCEIMLSIKLRYRHWLLTDSSAANSSLK